MIGWGLGKGHRQLERMHGLDFLDHESAEERIRRPTLIARPREQARIQPLLVSNGAWDSARSSRRQVRANLGLRKPMRQADVGDYCLTGQSRVPRAVPKAGRTARSRRG